jgi:hypothetical protein
MTGTPSIRSKELAAVESELFLDVAKRVDRLTPDSLA